MPITLNVGYSRVTRKPHCKRRVESKNVTGIVLKGFSSIDNGPLIRLILNSHSRKPVGPGWYVCGYARIR